MPTVCNLQRADQASKNAALLQHTTSCPAWLDAYAMFHPTRRGRKGTKYLVYTCRPKMPGTHSHCLGFGDRFRMIGFLLRLAAAWSRVLLIDWASPVPIESFFNANRIDWRLTDDERHSVEGLQVTRWGAGILGKPPDERFVRLVGNTIWHASIGNWPATGEQISNYTSPSLSCLWRFLFKPSDAMQRELTAQRVEMFGNATQPFWGLHVRMGDRAAGSSFATETIPKRDTRLTHAQAVALIGCIRRTAGTRLPMYIATDNAILKQAIKAGDPRTLIGNARSNISELTTAFEGVHVRGCTACMINPVFTHNFSRAEVEDIFVEMGLLVQSQCFYYAPSNFAETVKAWAGPQHCNRELGLSACLAAERKRRKGAL